jgi:hypothetical protein
VPYSLSTSTTSFTSDVEDATLRYLWEATSCLVRLVASAGERQARRSPKSLA